MAESIATFAIDKLLNFIDAKSKSLGSLPQEIQSIKNELSTIKYVLKDAEKKAEDDDRIMEWLSQVRHVSYRIEDTVDEYFLLEHKKQASTNLFSKTAQSILQLRPKHKLISTIRHLAKEILEIDSRRQRYEFITTETVVVQQHQGWQNQRDFSAYVQESQLIGVDEPKTQILSMLNVDEKNGCSNMVSVVGMGGLGKTTLVGKVYKEVKRYFDVHAWITVSQSYNTVDILKSIFNQFLKAAHHKYNHNPLLHNIDSLVDLQSVTNELRDYLEHKKMRHIVVLDDVWDRDMSLCIKSTLCSDTNGSRILMTTRNQDVANSWAVMIPGEVYNLKPLPNDEAWNLFCNKAFGTIQCPVELEMLSRDIVAKCNGLPLAIVTVGGLLSTKPKAVPEWRKLHDSLGSELERNPHLISITRILLLSYHELPYNLKPCFLYLGMFPEDFSINCMRLARLWIAEGFVECYRGKTLEDVAQEYLSTLIHRNLVQVSRIDERGRFREIKVHDILHNMILSRIEKLQFSQVLSENKPMINRHFRRLSSHDCINTIKDLQSSSSKSNFRSVLVSCHEKLVLNMFSGVGRKFVRYLRILDLQDSKIHEVPEELGDLYYLQYLSLRRTKVRELPRTIGKLWNLQTLDLKHSLVSELPKEVKHLHKLRHLLAYYYSITDTFIKVEDLRIPQGVLENFKELQKLAFLNVYSSYQVIELRSLKQLTRLAITELRKEDGVALCRAIQEMKHLKSLIIRSASQTELMNIQVLESPPLYLEYVSLTGLLQKLPKWISKLNSLTGVLLRNSRLNNDPLSLLQCLPNLVFLYLEKAYDGETLDFGINGFSKLEKLYLHQFGNLKSIEGSLPRIRTADIIVGKDQLIDVPTHIDFKSHITEYAGTQCQLLYL